MKNPPKISALLYDKMAMEKYKHIETLNSARYGNDI